MASDGSQLPYDRWPSSLADRIAQAREVFGQHLVAAHDSWVTTASRMLFEGYRYKSPTEEQQRFLDWIANLTEEERQSAFAFVREMVDGVVFSILNSIDGTSGSILRGEFRERLYVGLEVYLWSQDPFSQPEEPLETIPVSSRRIQESHVVELHEMWPGWQDRYSRWSMEHNE